MSEPVVVNLRLLARDIDLPVEKVQSVVGLLDEGHPVPFIARYRKDQTGNLNEDHIRAIQSELQLQRTLAERKQVILRSIDALGKLTPELEKKIREAKSTKRLEDLYLPYKPKKQTLASTAKSKGLEPLALEILEAKFSPEDLDRRAGEFINEDKGVKSVADALLGAGHIISEIFSEKPELRHQVRELVQRIGVIVSKKIETKKEAEGTVASESGEAAKPEKKRKERKGKKPGESTESQEAEKPSETASQESTETAAPKTDAPVVSESVAATGTAAPPDVLAQTTVVEQSVEAESVPSPSEPVAEQPEPVATQSEAEDHAGAGGGEAEPAESPAEPNAASPEPPVVEIPVAKISAPEAQDDCKAEISEKISNRTAAGSVSARLSNAEIQGKPGANASGCCLPHSTLQSSSPETLTAESAPVESQAVASDDFSAAPENSSATGSESNVAEQTEPAQPQPSTSVDQEAEKVDREFQQWKEQQKEQGIPVVKSQNQLKKKKQAERKKAKAARQQKHHEQLERLYHDYFDFQLDVRKMPPHRTLALNRGEKAKLLRVKLQVDPESLGKTAGDICVPQDHPHASFLAACVQDAMSRLILPSMEREVRNDLTEHAEAQAVHAFAKNLRSLLLQPPLYRKRVLALDPGFKHGCKMVALDEFGNVLAYETVYLFGSEEKKRRAETAVLALLEKFKISVIAIGTGTACRETEEFVANLIANRSAVQPDETAVEAAKPQSSPGISYVIVNEAGASVYSASPLAKEEFPDYDILLRGAISIGRRLHDPLNELVKIEPGSLGVGMYQHDLKPKFLQDSLGNVVESCVNYVGVDLNTATPAILRYVAGLNQLTAKRIYEYRQEHGPFKTREDLKKVPGIGEVAYTHCVGFLRIPGGSNPLDATWLHPETYETATRLLEQLGYTPEDLRQPEKIKEIAAKTRTIDVPAMSESLGVGPHTIRFILQQLAKPGRDPREGLPAPIFKKGILKPSDLSPGMELTGTILNVVDFGAFVDIGLHDSGLIHISQMADRYVRDAYDYVSVGDVVRVWVVEVNPERGRISLTMVPPGSAKPQQDRKREHGPRPRRDRDAAAPSGAQSADGKPSDRRPSSSPPRERSSEPRERKAPESGTPNQEAGKSWDRFRSPQKPQDGGSREGASRDGGRRDSGRRDSGAGRPPRDGNRDKAGGGRGWGDKGRRDGRRDRDRPDPTPKVFVSAPQEKVIAPISDEMKKGKEPLRSFGDLAQLFGRVQAVDPAEEKRRKKEEKKQRKAEGKPTPEQATVAAPEPVQTTAPEPTQTPAPQQPVAEPSADV